MDEDGRRRVGEKCRLCRNRKGWTQEELSERIGLSVNQISNIENGKTTVPTDTLIILSDVFGVSVDYLLNRKTNYVIEEDSNESKNSEMLKELIKIAQRLDVSEVKKLTDIAAGYIEIYSRFKK